VRKRGNGTKEEEGGGFGEKAREPSQIKKKKQRRPRASRKGTKSNNLRGPRRIGGGSSVRCDRGKKEICRGEGEKSICSEASSPSAIEAPM